MDFAIQSNSEGTTKLHRDYWGKGASLQGVVINTLLHSDGSDQSKMRHSKKTSVANIYSFLMIASGSVLTMTRIDYFHCYARKIFHHELLTKHSPKKYYKVHGRSTLLKTNWITWFIT